MSPGFQHGGCPGCLTQNEASASPPAPAGDGTVASGIEKGSPIGWSAMPPISEAGSADASRVVELSDGSQVSLCGSSTRNLRAPERVAWKVRKRKTPSSLADTTGRFGIPKRPDFFPPIPVSQPLPESDSSITDAV